MAFNASDRTAGIEATGGTAVYLAVDDRLRAVLGIADPLRPTAAEAVGALVHVDRPDEGKVGR